MAEKSGKPLRRAKRPRALTPEQRAELNLALEEEQEEGPVLPESAEEAAAEIDSGTRTPVNWWLVGLLALLALVVLLFAFEWMTGGSNTAVAPGSPSTPPRVQPR